MQKNPIKLICLIYVYLWLLCGDSLGFYLKKKNSVVLTLLYECTSTTGSTEYNAGVLTYLGTVSSVCLLLLPYIDHLHLT